MKISDSAKKVTTIKLTDDGTFPNNNHLPVLLYPGALDGDPEQADSLFNRHHWQNSWRDGIFNYHHYHSNAHEVLGVVAGSAIVQLGGDSGRTLSIAAGDVIVLPAGTAHKRLESSSDFAVVGAYPHGMDYNLRKGNDSDRMAALHEIPAVPLPSTDPVYGATGPLLQHWSAKP